MYVCMILPTDTTRHEHMTKIHRNKTDKNDPLQVTGEHLALACDALAHEALTRGSSDNITAMAVSLGSGPPPPPSAVGGRVLFSDGQ